VCLTVIGLFRLFRRTGEVESIADNLIALDAMVFLFACLFAYLALRTEREAAWRRLERFADALFLFGLAGMVVISGLVAYEFI
jgi:multisubunit Na+/H+ antiporter MnhF subunit